MEIIKRKDNKPLKVGDFIEILKEVNPETIIHLYSDAEGNEINPLHYIEKGKNSFFLVPCHI